MIAVKHNSVRTALMLIDKGADVNAKFEVSISLIYKALRYNTFK